MNRCRSSGVKRPFAKERVHIHEHCVQFGVESEPDEYEPDRADVERDQDYYDGRDQWLAEMTPFEVWGEYLRGADDSDRVQQLFDALVAAGCQQLALIEAILRLKGAYANSQIRRSEILEHSELVERLHKKDSPASTGEKFTLDDWKRMHDLLGRYAEHLQRQAQRAKRTPWLARKDALTSLMTLVQKQTRRRHYQLLSELLCDFVDDTLTEVNLRQHAKRAGLTKEGPAKPKSRPKRSTRGRPALPDARKVAKRLHFDREVGRIPGRNHD